jgi:c-di-GMP-binding flagellar brake protein YcgR
MLFKIANSPVVFALINISLGGAFGALTKHTIKDLKGSLLTVSQKIYNAGIVVPAANERAGETIIIKRSEVRRIEHDRDRNLYRYALEFTDIDPVEKRKLTQAIYHFQRMFLQRR